MKHIATVPAALVKAAMLFQAKSDVRHYLNGIMITKSHIVATDGHVMFVSPYESDLRPDEQMIVAIKGKIPAKAHSLELLYDDESKIGVVRCVELTPFSMKVKNRTTGEFEDVPPTAAAVLDSQGHQQCAFFHKIDGKYPDWERAVPTGEAIPTDRIGINFDFCARVAKACKELGSPFPQCAVNLRGAKTAIEVDLQSRNYAGAKAIIMPCAVSPVEVAA
ncbi:hypothetical protein JHD42_19945 [Aeromonas veronii]|uniref:hypothetical protein n=1 Tax=Aeromonas veronii TaxID=654 RepID=UPI0018F12C01|nr:hypothetical protein [Aeromonas veronii]MBJ7583326.1 hypothetical protein [Aeromonas veronii]